MHAISSYRGNRYTNKHSHTPTNGQDRLQYTAPQLARSRRSATNIFSYCLQKNITTKITSQ